MPTYVYRREDGSTFEKVESIKDEPLEECPQTGQSVKRVIQPASVRFRGGGYYASDYGGKNASL